VLLGLFSGSVLLCYGFFSLWRWMMSPARAATASLDQAGNAVQAMQQQALAFAQRIAAGASEVDQILSAAAKST
jgi:hypothetical protein